MNSIKAIVGLGNPGPQFIFTRHNSGFLVLDALAEQYGVSWQERQDMAIARISVNQKTVLLVKPLTFMNSSGKVVPFLQKQGIKPEDTIIVHDELELPFGKLALKNAGSAKGHNGLRSFIAHWGESFYRLRFGIGRPADKNDVGTYVLAPFSEPRHQVTAVITQAVEQLDKILADQISIQAGSSGAR